MDDTSSTASAPQESDAFLRSVTEMARRRPVVTSRAIYNENGVKLLEGGVVVDGSLYERLVSHRLKAPLEDCLASEPSVTGAVLRAGAKRLLDASPFFARIGPPGRIRDMVLEAVATIALPKPIGFQLTLMHEARPDLLEHSLQTALLCAHLVREGGAPVHDIRVAAAAGLLHDLGMLHIDPALLAPGQRLDGEQRRPLYVHPLTGSMQIGRFHDYPREVARAVLEHHERLDGSGYPRGLADQALSPLGRVLSLAEVVTAMFDGQRRHPEQRVSLLLRMNPRRYDDTLVPSIHRLLGAMPAPAEAGALLVEEVLHRVQLLSDVLAQWHATVAPQRGAVGAAGAGVLESIGDQLETLQRMLYEAGVSRAQLALLAEEDTRDERLRLELWVLEQELKWHLRATANQLRRRWDAAAAGVAMPEPALEWLRQVDDIAQG